MDLAEQGVNVDWDRFKTFQIVSKLSGIGDQALLGIVDSRPFGTPLRRSSENVATGHPPLSVGETGID